MLPATAKAIGAVMSVRAKNVLPLLSKRPEQLSVQEFIELTQFVENNASSGS
jgi:hypothetical protein